MRRPSGRSIRRRRPLEATTLLEWAEYYQREKKLEDDVKRYAEIAAYLREKEATNETG